MENDHGCHALVFPRTSALQTGDSSLLPQQPEQESPEPGSPAQQGTQGPVLPQETGASSTSPRPSGGKHAEQSTERGVIPGPGSSSDHDSHLQQAIMKLVLLLHCSFTNTSDSQDSTMLSMDMRISH